MPRRHMLRYAGVQMLQMAFKDRELEDAKRSAAERAERLAAELRQQAAQVGINRRKL